MGEEEDERDYPALNHYSKLPILTMTKCNGRDTIPVVQWNEERDGPFDDWDRLQLRFTSQVEQSPFWSRSRFRKSIVWFFDMFFLAKRYSVEPFVLTHLIMLKRRKSQPF